MSKNRHFQMYVCVSVCVCVCVYVCVNFWFSLKIVVLIGRAEGGNILNCATNTFMKEISFSTFIF